MVRQCAWCWSVADAAGRYRYQPGTKLREATHGICPVCCEREMAIIIESRDHEYMPELVGV